MSLREDMWKYEHITGESAEHVPIIKLGAFLDGYEMGLKALEQQPCEDCISRKAVLEYLDKMPSELTSDGRRMVRRRTLEEYISDTLPSVTPQTMWIPCSERLPERDTNVIAYHKNVSFEYVYVSWIDDYTGKWAGFIGNLPDDVLAWMPLPEPYKEESGEKE